MTFDWQNVTVVHALLGTATLVVAIALLVVLARIPDAVLARRRTIAFIVVLLLQAGVGLLQSFTGLPDALVALHLLGAALVWVGVLRVVLDVNPGLFPTVTLTPGEPARSLSIR